MAMCSICATSSSRRSPTAGSKMQRGYWQWIGDPIMPCGLVELIESRIGALPTPVGAVIDVLAVGEPIELAALRGSPIRAPSRKPTSGA